MHAYVQTLTINRCYSSQVKSSQFLLLQIKRNVVRTLDVAVTNESLKCELVLIDYSQKSDA